MLRLVQDQSANSGPPTAFDPDVFFHLDELIASQTEYMWSAAMAIATASALFAAFFIRKQIRSRWENVSICVFGLSILINLASIVPGYVAKNAMIFSTQEFLATSIWKPNETIEWANLWQSLLVLCGFISFVIAILISARTAASAAKSLGGGK